MRHEMTLVVRSTEVDSLGHVNNAKYLEYMEWGRVEWCAQTGMTMEALRQKGISPAVVSIHINYRRELRFGDAFTVVTRPLRLGNKSFVLRHELFNQAGEPVCDADVTMVVMDLHERRAIQLPEEIVRAFAGAQAEE